MGANSLALTVDVQYGKVDAAVTQEKYFAELEYGYSMTKNLSATVVLGYKNDKFSAYNYQSYVGPGLKYKTYKSEKQELNLEASILYSQDEIQQAFRAQATQFGLQTEYGSYIAKLTYELKIVEDLKFNQELSYRASFDQAENYFAFSNSELSNKLSDILMAGVGYKVDYTNRVPQGIKQQDSTLTAFLNIVY